MSTDTHFTSSLLKQSQLTASSHRLFWSQTVYRHTSVPSNPALGVYVTLSPPSIEQCPFGPSVMLTIVRGLPLGNRSFVSGCNVTGVSSFVDTVSSTASWGYRNEGSGQGVSIQKSFNTSAQYLSRCIHIQC